jgi:hypothetical protein
MILNKLRSEIRVNTLSHRQDSDTNIESVSTPEGNILGSTMASKLEYKLFGFLSLNYYKFILPDKCQ